MEDRRKTKALLIEELSALRAEHALERNRREALQGTLDRVWEDMRYLLQDAPIGIFRSTVRGRFLQANTTMASMLGYKSADEMLLRIAHIDTDFYVDSEQRVKTLGMLRERGTFQGVELEVRRADGGTMWLAIGARLTPAEKFEKAHIEGYAIDITGRKRTEEALIASEERFRLLAENMSDLVVLHDADGRLAYVSPSSRRILGYAPGEMVGTSLVVYVHPEDRSLVNGMVRRAVSTHQPSSATFRMRTKDGEYRWFDVSQTAVPNEQGEVVRLVSTSRDITERTRLEEEIRQARNFLDYVINTVPDPIFVKNREHQWVMVNGAFCGMVGRSRVELLGKTDADMFPPEEAEPFHRLDERVFKTGIPAVHEETMTDCTGEKRIMATKKGIVRMADTGEVLLVGVMRDITDMKRNEQALREAEENYRSIFENAMEGIFRSSVEGAFVEGNPALARILGDASPEGLKKRILSAATQLYVDPNRRDEFLRLMENQGAVSNFESQVYRKDGSIIWIEETAYAVRDEAGELLYFEGMVNDITERKRVERELAAINRHLENLVQERTRSLAQKAEELEEANLRLRELDDLKSALLSSISHELRTPLTSIRGFSNVVRRDFSRHFAPLAEGRLEAKAAAVEKNLDVIENESKQLARIITDILDISQLESHRAQWNDARAAPSDLVRGAVDAMALEFEAKPGVTLHVDVAPGLPEVLVDGERMTNVLVNLLENAVRHTSSGSVRVRAEEAEGAIRFEVEDTGTGVPEKQLGAIFETFHQATEGDILKDKPSGVGLGLAICRRVVEHYGGAIHAESEPGAGSRFRFEIPLKR